MSLIPIALFWMSLDYFLSQYGFDYISSLRERSREDSCLWKVFFDDTVTYSVEEETGG